MERVLFLGIGLVSGFIVFGFGYLVGLHDGFRAGKRRGWEGRQGMSDRFTVSEDGMVTLLVPNDPPIEDDWGFGVSVTAAEILAGARPILGDDLLADAIQRERSC